MCNLPTFVSAYAGDTLWALLIFWLTRALKPALPILVSASIAVGFAFFIEFSQLYHAPWIDSIRSHTLGGLVLGFGFKASDLVCYSVGVLIGYILNTSISGQADVHT